MKLYRLLSVTLIISFLLGACGTKGNGDPLSELFPTSTPLPTPHVGVTPAPDARAAVSAYFDALKSGYYAGMYGMLTKISQQAITQDDFSKRYNDALNNMSAGSFDYEILSSLLSPYKAQVGYRVIYHTALVGDIQRDIVMDLANENNQWKVEW